SRDRNQSLVRGRLHRRHAFRLNSLNAHAPDAHQCAPALDGRGVYLAIARKALCRHASRRNQSVLAPRPSGKIVAYKLLRIKNENAPRSSGHMTNKFVTTWLYSEKNLGDELQVSPSPNRLFSALALRKSSADLVECCGALCRRRAGLPCWL